MRNRGGAVRSVGVFALASVQIALLAFSLTLLVLEGCVATRDYGRGQCFEYSDFVCFNGDKCCRTDDKGCKVCTCQSPCSPVDTQQPG